MVTAQMTMVCVTRNGAKYPLAPPVAMDTAYTILCNLSRLFYICQYMQLFKLTQTPNR